MKLILSLGLFVVLLSGCATSYEVTPAGRALRTQDEYYQVIEGHTDSSRRYSGFYNVLDMEGTLLTSSVLEAQLDQDARIYQWDENKYGEEKGKNLVRLNKESEVFLSFFTPNKKDDDVSKNTSNWRIFMDANGKRYEGKVTKIKSLLSELESRYPFHNRFYTPYKIIFPVPMKEIENQIVRVTVTSPVASGTLEFRP